MSNLKNINLDVANFAMRSVQEVKESEYSKKYKTLAKKMSVMIQKNGFIGTLVFNLSKNKSKDGKANEHEEVLRQIREWNKRNYKISDIIKVDKKMDSVKYIEAVTQLSSQNYRLITKEMMTLFGWIKRFTDGMIEGEE